jgi:hypothetical protein
MVCDWYRGRLWLMARTRRPMSLVTLRVLPFANLAKPWETVVAIRGAPRLRIFVWWVHLGERAWFQHVQFLVLDGSVAPFVG